MCCRPLSGFPRGIRRNVRSSRPGLLLQWVPGSQECSIALFRSASSQRQHPAPVPSAQRQHQGQREGQRAELVYPPTVSSQETSNPLETEGRRHFPWIQQVASAASGAFEPVLGEPVLGDLAQPRTLYFSTPFEGCAQDVYVINEKPSTKAEVEFALLRRKILRSGQDPPEIYLCTLENRHVYVALFKVFAPGRGVPPPQLKDNVHVSPIRHQSGFDNDIVVMDLEGRDGSGIWHSYRLCHDKRGPGVPSPPGGYSEQNPELKYWLGLLEQGERLTSVSLASRCSDTPEEALSYLVMQLTDMVFSCVAPSKQTVRQHKGHAQIGPVPAHDSHGVATSVSPDKLSRM
eukprot:s4269_g2.t1